MIEEEARDVNNQNVVDSGAKSENQSQEQVQKTHESQEPAEGSKEYNFARLREKADLADRKNAELERKIIELTQAFEKKNAPVEEDELSQLAPDDILTVDQATKLSEKQARKIVQEMLKQQEINVEDINLHKNPRHISQNALPRSDRKSIALCKVRSHSAIFPKFHHPLTRHKTDNYTRHHYK